MTIPSSNSQTETLGTAKYEVLEINFFQFTNWNTCLRVKNMPYDALRLDATTPGDPKARFRRRTFQEPNLIYWIKYMKSSASESIRNACFNLERLSRSFRLARPEISPLERLWNGKVWSSWNKFLPIHKLKHLFKGKKDASTMPCG